MAKILRSEIYLLRFPLDIRLPWGTEKYRNHILVKIRTTETEGVGEGTPFYTHAYNSHALGIKIAKTIQGQKLPDALEALSKIQECLVQNRIVDYGILLAFETAILDALSKASGFVMAKELGKIYRKKIPAAGTVYLAPISEMVRFAKYWASQGITHLKIKVTGNEDIDCKIVKQIREAVGPRIALRIDANQAYEKAEKAAKTLRKLEEHGIIIAEQPIRWCDWDGLRKLRKMTNIKIMVDESVWKPSDIDLIATKKVADVVNFHPPKFGCLSVTRKLIEKALDLGLEYVIGGAVMSGVGVSAYMHLVASLREIQYPTEEIGLFNIRGYDIVKKPIGLTRGCLKLPTAGGLGVKLDNSAVKKYQLEFNPSEFRVLLTRMAYSSYSALPWWFKNRFRFPFNIVRQFIS